MNVVLVPDRMLTGRGFVQFLLTVPVEKALPVSTGDLPTALLGELWVIGLLAICCCQGNGHSVMVHFMCQCGGATGCPDTWLNTISVSVCEGISGRD